MKARLSLLALFIALLGLGQPLVATAEPQVVICAFASPLSYNGTQWRVKAITGPVYLARWERGSWVPLAVFDGTNGTYRLDWASAKPGHYAALDSFGRISETLTVKGVIERLSLAMQPPDFVTAHARRLFAAMGIHPDDFGLQHFTGDVAVYGGTNRLIATLRDDESAWDFRIDRQLCTSIRVARWDVLPDAAKTLSVPTNISSP